jgi:hypothetical protein
MELRQEIEKILQGDWCKYQTEDALSECPADCSICRKEAIAALFEQSKLAGGEKVRVLPKLDNIQKEAVAHLNELIHQNTQHLKMMQIQLDAWDKWQTEVKANMITVDEAVKEAVEKAKLQFNPDYLGFQKGVDTGKRLGAEQERERIRKDILKKILYEEIYHTKTRKPNRVLKVAFLPEDWQALQEKK